MTSELASGPQEMRRRAVKVSAVVSPLRQDVGPTKIEPAGRAVLISASLCPFSESLAMSLNRREFLVAGGAVALTALSAGSLEGAPDKRRNELVIYRYSVHGRRASRAAKEFSANLRFRTPKAAAAHPKPHAGFNGRLVEVVVTSAEYQHLFTTRNADVADLRHLKNVTIIGLG